MFEIRTDLALEAHEIASKNKEHILDGVIFNEYKEDNYTITRVEIISPDGEKATGKPIGKYLTLQVGKMWDRGNEEIERVCNLLARMITELSGSCESVMVVGLGNTTITADALGPKVLSHLIVTRHLKNASPEIFSKMHFFDVSAISPGVLSQTGIEALEIVKSVTDKLKPSLVIAIDALASRDMARLGTVIQISDTGISPGSGVGNSRPALNVDSLGVPVVSIGIPTVVDAVTLTSNVIEMCGENLSNLSLQNFSECENMFVTPKDCDKIISFMSRVIGYSINTAFHSELTFEDIMSVLS